MSQDGGGSTERPRFFTPGDARRMLPLVSRIVADLVATYPAIQDRVRELQSRVAIPSPASDDPGIVALRRAIEADAERVNGWIAELQELGCHFKGFEEGLVDWYALYEGRPIFLCWKLGEADVEWWHEVEEGFAGRQRITPEMEKELAEV